jgi:hypothetical protein
MGLQGKFKISLAVFVLLLGWQSSFAALRNCTDVQIIEMVCGTQHPDSTGASVSMSDFTVHETTVSENAYQKFLSAFHEVVEAYDELFAQLPEKNDGLYLSNRLNALTPPTKAYLDTNPISAFITGANGTYSYIDEQISLTPTILNVTKMSQVELEMFIAHELGHYLDPDMVMMRQIPFMKSLRPQVFSQGYNSCFKNNFREWSGRKPSTEDYADFMASQVAAHFARSSDENDRLAKTLNLAYSFCPSEHKTIKSESPDFGTNLDDSHAPSQERILTYLRDPEILRTMGCEAEIVRAQTGRAIESCQISKFNALE